MIELNDGQRDSGPTVREWFAVLGLLAAVWGFVIGVVLATVAPNGFPGALLTVVSALVAVGLFDWLLGQSSGRR